MKPKLYWFLLLTIVFQFLGCSAKHGTKMELDPTNSPENFKQKLVDAFQLGTTYAKATRIRISQDVLDAESQSAFEHLMSESEAYGNRLGILVMIPATKQDIIRRISEHTGLIEVHLESGYGPKPAALFNLGYRTGMAPLFFPRLSEIGEDFLQEHYTLASSIDLPAEILDKLKRELSQSESEDQSQAAVSAFHDDVLLFLDGKTFHPPDETALQRWNTWKLGSQLSLVALASAQGFQEKVKFLLPECHILAKELNVRVPALPKGTGNDFGSVSPSAAAIWFLLVEVGGSKAANLRDSEQLFEAQLSGMRFSSLYELAVKSMLLTVFHSGGDPTDKRTGALMYAIKRSGKKAGLPGYLWKPLLEKMRKSAPHSEVKETVITMHQQVDQYLSQQLTGKP